MSLEAEHAIIFPTKRELARSGDMQSRFLRLIQCSVLLCALGVASLCCAEDAFESVKTKANTGDRSAQYELGELYRTGNGVATNATEAQKWYRKAADKGDARAQYNLGVMYYNGQGVTKDEVEAVKWYRKAADQGHAPAQHNLGVMYANGHGVVKDEVEAYKWLLLAGAVGTKQAREGIPLIEKGLTDSQRAEGQRLAREFRPHMSLSR